VGEQMRTSRGGASGPRPGAVLVLLLWPMLWSLPMSSPRAAPEEYALKAAYLYNFVKYIDWPEDRFDDASDAYRVCVVGEDPFGDHLIRATRGKTVRRRVIELVHFGQIEDGIETCHLVFVAGEGDLVGLVLESFPVQSIIMVGEGPFARRGGIASFVRTQGGFGVELNMRAARERELRVSGRLQQIATIVED